MVVILNGPFLQVNSARTRGISSTTLTTAIAAPLRKKGARGGSGSSGSNHHSSSTNRNSGGSCGGGNSSIYGDFLMLKIEGTSRTALKSRLAILPLQAKSVCSRAFSSSIIAFCKSSFLVTETKACETCS